MKNAMLFLLACVSSLTYAQTTTQETMNAPSGYNEELAHALGADEHGMKKYVLVVLKTGPNTMLKGPERDAMFKGHFANIQRLADEGKIALAGPFDGSEGWRGLFVFATGDIELAKSWVATDPVIVNGEMVAEYHKYYGSAALMMVTRLHKTIALKDF
ncbi:YciI family protein [Undibacterium sp. SXout20W]|uniref:YciI family protein n=1 Tax=Undibacterium sp. SXout20W TaxID=3413051 RepID=UPI003BEF5E9B